MACKCSPPRGASSLAHDTELCSVSGSEPSWCAQLAQSEATERYGVPRTFTRGRRSGVGERRRTRSCHDRQHDETERGRSVLPAAPSWDLAVCHCHRVDHDSHKATDLITTDAHGLRAVRELNPRQNDLHRPGQMAGQQGDPPHQTQETAHLVPWVPHLASATADSRTARLAVRIRASGTNANLGSAVPDGIDARVKDAGRSRRGRICSFFTAPRAIQSGWRQ